MNFSTYIRIFLTDNSKMRENNGFFKLFQSSGTVLHVLKDAIFMQIILFSVIHMVSLSTLPPVFNYRPSNVTYHVGQTAILKCSISNLGSREVIWKSLKSPHALTIGEFVFVKDPNYSIKHIPYKDEWNLVIENVKPEHAGKYECQISTKEDLIRHVVLTVRNEPVMDNKNNTSNELSDIFISGPQYVEKGHPIRLTCNVNGTLRPPDDIDWFQKGVKLKNNPLDGIYIRKYVRTDAMTLTSQLKITESDVTDTGTYICRSSKNKITTHYLSVLNSESTPHKRGTLPETVNIVKQDARASAKGIGSRLVTISFTYTLWPVVTMVSILIV